MEIFWVFFYLKINNFLLQFHLKSELWVYAAEKSQEIGKIYRFQKEKRQIIPTCFSDKGV